MIGMLFFEVFETLNVTEELGELFRDIKVIKVTISKKTGQTLVFIESTHLLSRKQIKAMEFQLQKQLFQSQNNKVGIVERYLLSAQYDPEKLWTMHRENIMDELMEESVINYNILKSSEIEFNDSTMILKIENTFLNHKKGEEIQKFLEPMFRERYGFDLSIRFDFYDRELTNEEEEDREEPRRYVEKDEEHRSSDQINNNSGAVGDGRQDTSKEIVAKEDNGQSPKKNEKSSSYEKGKYAAKKQLPEDPDIFFGRSFDGEPIPIKEIQEEIGEVVIRGRIESYEDREIRNEKFLVSFAVTDFTDTIAIKLFVKNDMMDDIKKSLKNGNFVKLKGMALYDKFDREITISSVIGIKKIPSFLTKRVDHYPQKRVELHAHTVMSDMDAVVDTKALIKTAFEWGHPAIAITDHGVVQSFPEANHALNPKDYAADEEKMARAKAFKVIYGMEAYIVDDLKESVRNDQGQSIDDTCVIFDIETTGFGPVKDKIIEIGAVKIKDGTIIDTFSTFINPQVPIPYEITKLTSITDEMVMEAPNIETVLPSFIEFIKDSYLVAHNASFDVGFITKKAELLGLPLTVTSVDTVGLARTLMSGLHNFKLDTVAKALDISLENHHRAIDDASCTAQIYLKFIQMLLRDGITTLAQMNEHDQVTPEVIKKMPTYHCILLCQNNTGRVNLYRMVSLSHIDYFARRPRIPKSLLMKHHEGILIGSACEAGELYQAILRNEGQSEIMRLAKFYDYYEIQPLGNNQFMIESDKIDISSSEDLMEINRKIVALGEEYKKPVVATCDVHFLNPEDEVYRRIIMSAKGFADADRQPPLYLRTTEEMLEEFKYLGKEKAEEVVITNTVKICDMIEKISPVRPDKCAPIIENSDHTLRTICYEKAHSMYGEHLPQIVSDRLEHELKSIITNGFAVMYIIAQKLVWKSNEDGYLVGSRGSVGSSFAATMSGITEVNPLPAHYYCPHCYYSDFTSDVVKSFAASSGCDMPDQVCPNCGEPLEKDGHNIPFETFLGFNGDKEPDIDLNFSGEYQSKAHEYTEVIFGAGQTFRAGTIGTLADKTAFGFVMKYYDEHNEHKRVAEVNRLVSGCVGVRRTTGQHPGGIIVLPLGEEIYSFTPVQRPANDMTTKTITTHFDYHSIDHNLLKLDILGHDDPTMIRMLEDLTGIDAKKIRMDDKKVISLFESTQALGIKPEDIGGCDLGSLGLPELGTDFVMQMLRDTKPKCFSDMIRISGLSHGTDVWLNNTQTLIAEGKCTLSTAICTRDDIMTYLIQMGVENGLAFKIMESVRKGKGLTPDMEAAMLEKDIPDWYIWSCKRIKYMFPKAHAAAYVMMAFRIAYFKVYYPLAYYAAYFSIRASAFNYELMCLGRERLEYHMNDYKRRMTSNDPSVKLTKKEEDVVKDMKIVQELYARGFNFVPIDIYTAKAHHFQIIGDKLMPALSTIDGLGDKAADQVVEAVKDGKFLSREDFKNRCKVSGTVVDLMADLGLMGDLPATNQISLMDFLM